MFFASLKRGEQSKPLDGLISGFILAELQNLGKTVPLGVDSAANLIPRLKQLPSLDLKDPVLAQLKGRMEANGQGLGRFAKGSSDMAEAFSQMPELASALAKVDTSAANKEGLTDEEKFLHLAAGIFRSGVAKTAILVLSTDQAVDTHDEGGAKASPALAQAVVGKLDKIFKAMGDIEFGPGQSLWDVTTLMFGSEFGRTMRQSGKPIDNTGTDHNPLNNSFLIGGKGVKSNLVIGASDFKTADEELSGAHLSKDKESMKTVGRPFDFQTQSSREDKPAEFKADDYLNVASVVNTIYHLYGVSSEHYRSLSRNGSSAPILTALLK